MASVVETDDAEAGGLDGPSEGAVDVPGLALPAAATVRRRFARHTLDGADARAALLDLVIRLGQLLRGRDQAAARALTLTLTFAGDGRWGKTRRLAEPSGHDDDLRLIAYQLMDAAGLQRGRLTSLASRARTSSTPTKSPSRSPWTTPASPGSSPKQPSTASATSSAPHYRPRHRLPSRLLTRTAPGGELWSSTRPRSPPVRTAAPALALSPSPDCSSYASIGRSGSATGGLLAAARHTWRLVRRRSGCHGGVTPREGTQPRVVAAQRLRSGVMSRQAAG
ncbi:DinB/UmuC family translesion DNA polymerase [Streptomyces chartreusis]|uniref:DinB/UmuC family translesion DNA polymerase n=1 Tax=Streptomyces chartreusis TaxID=1969 RepID=UPI00365AE3D6